MSDLSKIPCTIVTGFLGAGKTTLVRHLLENAGGRRLAVARQRVRRSRLRRFLHRRLRHQRLHRGGHRRTAERLHLLHRRRRLRPRPQEAPRPAERAGAHPHRDLRARPAEAARQRLQLAGDPLPRHGGRRRRGGRRAGRGCGLLRRRSAGPCRSARRRRGGRARQSARGGLRGPAPVRRHHPAQQDRPDGHGRPAARAGRRSARSLPRSVKIVETAHGQLDPAVVIGLERCRRSRSRRAPLAPRDRRRPRPRRFRKHRRPRRSSDEPRRGPRPGSSAPPRRAACCGSRASRRSMAGRCASSCRASAGASPTISTGPGRRTRRADGRLVVIGLKGFDRAAVEAALAAADMHLLPVTTVSLDESERGGRSRASRRATSWCCRSPTAISRALGERAGAASRRGPSLRLASLRRLRHPLSVDLYVETRPSPRRASCWCAASAGATTGAMASSGSRRPAGPAASGSRCCRATTGPIRGLRLLDRADALCDELDAYFRAGGVGTCERLLVRHRGGDRRRGAAARAAEPRPARFRLVAATAARTSREAALAAARRQRPLRAPPRLSVGDARRRHGSRSKRSRRPFERRGDGRARPCRVEPEGPGGGRLSPAPRSAPADPT